MLIPPRDKPLNEKLINLNTTNNLIEKDNTDKQVKYKKSEADRGEVFYQ